ncbi:MAG: hypothetical protein ACE366_20870 [Bradymonadia bacterium]
MGAPISFVRRFNSTLFLALVALTASCDDGSDSGSTADANLGADGAIGADGAPPPVGACCGSSCTQETQGACEGTGRAFIGANVACDPDPCAVGARGACCLPEGGCGLLGEAACISARGAFEGAGTACEDADRCPPPSTGACCDPLGMCTQETSTLCAQAGSLFIGDAVACNPDPCPAGEIGACCGDDSCAIDDARRCRGEFLGEGSTCAECPGAPDAMPPPPDAEIPDAEIPNAEIPDAEIPNAEVPDADPPDASVGMMEDAAPPADAGMP